MKIQEMIKKYKFVSTEHDGKLAIKANVSMSKITKADQAFIKENIEEMKTAVVAKEEAERKEAKEKEAATITFYSTGWETHEISIDTRKDVNEQLQCYAEYHSNDCTFESLLADYNRTLDKKAATESKIESENARVNEIKERAINTGTRQIISQYMADCNDPREECSTDHVTVWAMPDGTTVETRLHTW